MSARLIPLLPLAVLFLLGALTFWLASIVQPTSARADGKTRHDPDLIIEKFTTQMLSPEGQVQYVLTASSMRHYPDDDSSELVDVVFTAQQPGQPDLRVTAPRGRALSGNDRIVMEGGVLMETSATAQRTAKTLTTPRLTLLPPQNIARSTDGVVISSTEGTVTAATFEFNNATRIATFERGSMTFKARTKDKDKEKK